MNIREFIIDTFLRLTSKTCPYGYEDEFVKDIMSFIFPDNIKKDMHGNYFYQIGKSRTIFTSHIDTVSREYVDINQLFDGDIVRTDGNTTLGADDKAGITVMLWMIRNKIPGLYYFFIGEEVGCIGSGLASKYGDFKGKYDRIISFDRRGTDSVITYQSSTRCCSNKFAQELSEQLNKCGMSYKKDDTGVYTDSAEFMSIIPECTNISVGYYKEHTTQEYQDINHLISLANACVNVDWEKLSVERDPLIIDYKTYASDWISYERDYSKKKRKRRQRNKKYSSNSRSYFDSGGCLVELDQLRENDHLMDLDGYNENKKEKYTWIMVKLTSKEFTWGELQIVKDCYLNMDSEYDRYFYEYLKEELIDF